MKARCRIKFIELKKLTMPAAAAFALLFLTAFGQGVSALAAKNIDPDWLKLFFCRAVPFAQSQIKPRVSLSISLSDMLFGFDLSKPQTIIFNQIAAVKAAEKYNQAKETEESEPVTVMPAFSEKESDREKDIREITVDLQNTEENNVPAKDINIRNHTDYEIDVQKLLNEKPGLKLDKNKPSVLIVHTHTSEAFAPSAENNYTPSDPDRTEDENFNITRVGSEMAKVLSEAGIKTLHDKTLHDYPSYNGSYKNCLATVQRYLKEYPSIKVVLDIHRDAMQTSDGKKLKVCTTIDNKKTAQVMIVCGSDANGLEHPKWRENLKLALRFQAKMNELYPGLARPLSLVRERYNMHTSEGSLLIEIGSNGNTLEEAINGGRSCAVSIAQVLKELSR